MVAFNEKELVGNLIPNAYISKITLQTSGDVIKENDPHITRSGSINPESSGSSSKQLKATVDLTVKERLSEELNSSWFDNIDLKKYIKIQLIQSKNEKTTQFLINGIDAIRYCTDKELLSDLDKRDIEEVAKTIFETNDLLMIDNVLLENIDSLSISLGENNSSNISKNIFFEDDDGKKIYDIKYTKTYGGLPQKPKHLAYFLYTTFDIEQLSRDFNISANESDSFKNIYGKISTDIIIDEYETVSKASYFEDEQGKIWLGDVEQDDNGNWVSQEDNSIRLFLRETANNKVQDFRNFEEIKKKLEYSLTNQNQFLQKNPIKILGNVAKIDAKKEKYFSDLKISRQSNGNPKLLFSFNYERFLTRESKYGKFLQESEMFKNEYFKYLNIKSLKLYRQKIRSLTDTDVIDNEELIESLTDPQQIQEKQITFFTENENNNEIKSYHMIDSTFENNIGGTYTYAIEISVEDTFNQFIKDKISILMNKKTELQSYYEISNIPKIIRENPETKNPHINNLAIYTKSEIGGHFDQENNEFTAEFQKYVAQNYGTNLPYVSALDEYIGVLKIFYNISEAEETKYRLFITSICSEQTGNPQGILTFISIIDGLISVLAKISGTNIDGALKNTPTITAKNNLISIKNTFKEVFDSNEDKNPAFEYLLTSSQKPQYISIADFESRFLQENNKYAQNDMVCFTPIIYEENILKKHNLFDTNLTNAYFILSSIKNDIIVNNSLKNLTNKTEEKNETDSKVSDYNLNDEQLKQYVLYKNMGNSVLNRFSMTIENFEISPESKYNIDPYKAKNINKKNINLILDSLLYTSEDSISKESAYKTFINNTNTTEPVPPQIGLLKNSTKTLFLTNENMSNIQKKQLEYFYITTTLKNVEYLSDFEKLENNENVADEKWQKVTSQKIKQFKLSAGKHILCRLVPYQNNRLGINKGKKNRYRFYDQYFIIKT